MVTAPVRREVVREMVTCGLSERRALAVVRMSAAALRYVPAPDRNQAVVWISTVTIQVPIQLELSAHGRSRELLARLIETNFWYRRISYAVCAVLFLWMAAQVIGAGSDERRAA